MRAGLLAFIINFSGRVPSYESIEGYWHIDCKLDVELMNVWLVSGEEEADAGTSRPFWEGDPRKSCLSVCQERKWGVLLHLLTDYYVSHVFYVLSVWLTTIALYTELDAKCNQQATISGWCWKHLATSTVIRHHMFNNTPVNVTCLLGEIY